MNTNILLCCTGSVATIKAVDIINSLKLLENVEIKVVFTKCALHFCDVESVSKAGVTVYQDQDEWTSWTQRGDPVLHIELGKWADMILIAPLDANTLAKIAQVLKHCPSCPKIRNFNCFVYLLNSNFPGSL